MTSPVAIPLAKEQTAASTGVSFPVTESPTISPTASFEQPSSTGLRPPHLPFRRISLPTVPSLQPTNRLSVASAASIDIGVVLEEPPPSAPPTVTTTPIPPLPLTPNKNPGRRTRTTSRPISVDNKRGKRSELKTVDESKEDKRRKVIEEFYETERTYVHGLDLIYSQFLEPIIASLDTPTPLLERSELTAVFSNFIDIWNLHRAFFSSLTEHLRPFLNSTASSPGSRDPPPPMSPLLLSHFPYLSLYTPFVTSFHTSVLALTQLLTGNAAFSTFVAKQEADPICGKLKLRDWLLTIVQRCPRYLLLLKDLIGCTDPDDLEAQSLAAVHTLVSKITSSLNTSLHTHAQTLQLLALQRATPNLPFQLITPGRTFLKRGQLSHQTRGALLRPREFLLFSDCLLWLESVDAEAGAWDSVLTPPKLHLGASSKPGASPSKVSGGGQVSRLSRPRMLRSRSRSEAELGLKASTSLPQTSTPKRQASSSNGEERWNFRGRAELVDLEVVVPPAVEEDDCMRFEVLSPEESFAVYAESEDERAAWVTAIRNAKAALFVTLNATHPNSTLTSSSSTHHLRRALQALPHLPEDDGRRPKRGRVEHFVPAVWIPDAKTDGCMRCAKPFGWRRRRHHCRLCGRCVCSSCSGSTFFIADAMAQNSKPARACNSCYETVFPVMTPTTEIPPALSPSTAPTLTLSSFQQPQMMTPGPQRSRPASVLMALDAKRASRFEDAAGTLEDALAVEHASDVPVVRIKAAPRSRSYHQIFQDFGGAQSAASLLSTESVDSLADAALQSETEGSVGSGFRRIEDTERRKKRFSLPAVALQTTSVMAHAAAAGTGRAKRFSLVLGGGGRVRAAKSGSAESVGLGVGAGGPGGAGDVDPDATVKPSPSQIRGPAALSLTELLGRDNRAAVGA